MLEAGRKIEGGGKETEGVRRKTYSFTLLGTPVGCFLLLPPHWKAIRGRWEKKRRTGTGQGKTIYIHVVMAWGQVILDPLLTRPLLVCIGIRIDPFLLGLGCVPILTIENERELGMGLGPGRINDRDQRQKELLKCETLVQSDKRICHYHEYYRSYEFIISYYFKI
jgi:hypothetical protein